MKVLTFLLILCAMPAAADEGYFITPIGDRWYMVTLTEPIVLPTPEGAWRTGVSVYLDDIPGGLDSGVTWHAHPLSHVDRLAVSIVGNQFAPLPYSTYPVAFAGAVLRNESGHPERYRVKLYVRGKE